MTWPTPSKLALAEACAFPWHPQLAPAWPVDPPSSDAAFGTAFHRAMQCAAVLGVSPTILEAIVEENGITPGDQTKLLGCVEVGVELLEQSEPHFRASEVSILYDVEKDTARLLPEALERDEIPPGFIHGTVDLLEQHVPSVAVIIDWKTGERSAVELDVREDWQLRTYALMAARALGVAAVEIEIRHVTEAGVVPDRHRLDGFDLADARGKLRRLLAQVDAGGAPNPGRHCTTRYCPMVGACPATQKALAEVQQSLEAQIPMGLVIRNHDEARQVRVGLKVVEKALEQYKAALHAYVDQHGAFELAPDVLYGRTETAGDRRIDAGVAGAIDAINDHFEEDADIALEVSTSFAAIDRAARATAKRKGIAGKGAVKQVTEPLLERLQQMGAIRQGGPKKRYEDIVVKAKKGEAA
jgi:hypothetical protein